MCLRGRRKRTPCPPAFSSMNPGAINIVVAPAPRGLPCVPPSTRACRQSGNRVWRPISGRKHASCNRIVRPLKMARRLKWDQLRCALAKQRQLGTARRHDTHQADQGKPAQCPQKHWSGNWEAKLRSRGPITLREAPKVPKESKLNAEIAAPLAHNLRALSIGKARRNEAIRS